MIIYKIVDFNPLSVYICVYTEICMITKVFNSGNSQAVRIPKEFHIDSSELLIKKVGSSLILTPKENNWENLEKSLYDFSDDFFANGRNQFSEQIREDL